MQEALARSERALRRQATILDERNAALRVLLEQREQDHRELEQRIVQNVEQLIEPTLDRLSRTLAIARTVRARGGARQPARDRRPVRAAHRRRRHAARL